MTPRARHRMRSRRSPVLAGGLVIALLFALALWPVGKTAPSSSAAATPSPAYFTPASLPSLLNEGLTDRPVPHSVAAQLLGAATILPSGYSDGCHVDQTATMAPACTYGDVSSMTSVWLIGDSHAEQWLPALEVIGLAHHWKIVAINKSACPPVAPGSSTTFNSSAYPQCSTWNAYVLARIKAARPSLVIVTALASEVVTRQRSMTAYLASLKTEANHVLLLGDTPNPSTDIPSCIATHLDNAATCALDPIVAAPAAQRAAYHDIATAAGVAFQPTTRWFCVIRGCPVIVDTTLMYRDNSHLTVSASRKYAPVLDQALLRADPSLP